MPLLENIAKKLSDLGRRFARSQADKAVVKELHKKTQICQVRPPMPNRRRGWWRRTRSDEAIRFMKGIWCEIAPLNKEGQIDEIPAMTVLEVRIGVDYLSHRSRSRRVDQSAEIKSASTCQPAAN